MEPYASIVKKQLAQILEKEPNAILIEKNIVVLKNWLSDDFCDRLVNHVESFGEDIWWDKNKREWWHGKFFFVEDPKLDAELKHMRIRLQELFRQELWVESMNSVHRMTEGQSMFEHADNLAESLGLDNKCVFGVTHYINNFEGGEIYYPDYEYLYKPKAGSMALHKGNTRHGVKKVTLGERFCGASLVTIKGNWNENPQPARTDDPKNPYFYPPGYWGKRASLDPIQGDIKIPRSDGSVAKYNPSPEIL